MVEKKLWLHAQVFEAEIFAPRAGMLSGPPGQPEAIAARLMEKVYGSS